MTRPSLYQYINDGGANECIATHVKFISLPLLTNISELPSILARETAKEQKNEKNVFILFLFWKMLQN